jgi:hypothetical protein
MRTNVCRTRVETVFYQFFDGSLKICDDLAARDLVDTSGIDSCIKWGKAWRCRLSRSSIPDLIACSFSRSLASLTLDACGHLSPIHGHSRLVLPQLPQHIRRW